MDDNGISIAVIGGGIGGLTAAICLRKIGIDVHVYEQARVLREVGAGINVSPNATRIIHALGLGEGLAKLGVIPTGVHQRRWDDGCTLLRTPLGTEIERHFGFPHYQSHRADVLTEAILNGSQPTSLTFAQLQKTLPLGWADQRNALHFEDSTSGR